MIDPQLRDKAVGLTDSTLRQFAATWIVFFGALAGYEAIQAARVAPGTWMVFAAAVVGLPGLVRPRTIEPLFRAAMAVSTPIGWVVSHVLLAVVFYAVITPLAVLFRLIGRDVLARRFDSHARTRWFARRQSGDPLRYWHQS